MFHMIDRTDFQLIDIIEDGFVSLLADNGNTKDDLRLPSRSKTILERGKTLLSL